MFDCLDKESNWFAWLLCKCPPGASPEYNSNILRGSRPILKFSSSQVWLKTSILANVITVSNKQNGIKIVKIDKHLERERERK